MKNYYFDQNLSQCRKFITVMKIYYGDENYHQVYQIEGKRSAHEPNQFDGYCVGDLSPW